MRTLTHKVHGKRQRFFSLLKALRFDLHIITLRVNFLSLSNTTIKTIKKPYEYSYGFFIVLEQPAALKAAVINFYFRKIIRPVEIGIGTDRKSVV